MVPRAQPLRGSAACDPSSLSNPGEARVTHADLALCVDFAARRVVGTAALRVRAEVSAVAHLRLDTRGLRVASATWRACDADGAFSSDASATDAAFTLGDEQGALGSPLTVALPPGLPQGATGVVTLAFATSPESSACQWLQPAQTAGGKHPYLFTQCQAIHARALLPVQDSPAAKLTCVSYDRFFRAMR
jgi:leukotriene-A4 hydrolase